MIKQLFKQALQSDMARGLYRRSASAIERSRVARTVLFGRSLGAIYEELGFHVVPAHFYHPVPAGRDLSRHEARFDEPSALPGVDMRLPAQIALLDALRPWFAECDFPREKQGGVEPAYYVRNGSYGHLSAAVLHAMVRELRPSKVVEVGSGMSTLVTARALTLNAREGAKCDFRAIEPYPPPHLRAPLPGLSGLLQQKVEEVPMEVFTALGEGDILFIDSSHVVKTFGDVNHLYLEVLPRLRKGVTVHVHDIFFPFEYPKSWVIDNRWYWTEQYLLQAFLMFNSAFEVQIAERYLREKASRELSAAFPFSLGEEDNFDSNSLWMRRVR
ncbi:MAG: class I SAM-dependent methyltransferase [Byssovorax sp.]